MAHDHPNPPDRQTEDRRRFDSPAEAREAIIDLERHGVDADNIVVDANHHDTREFQRRGADEEMAKTLFGRGAVGGVIGTVVGAAIGLVVTLAFGVDPQPAAPLGAAIGGGLLLGAMGAYYGAVSKLPVTEGAVELPGAESGEVDVTVESR